MKSTKNNGNLYKTGLVEKVTIKKSVFMREEKNRKSENTERITEIKELKRG